MKQFEYVSMGGWDRRAPERAVREVPSFIQMTRDHTFFILCFSYMDVSNRKLFFRLGHVPGTKQFDPRVRSTLDSYYNERLRNLELYFGVKEHLR